MPKQHKIKQGDSIDSLAYENGIFWETIWNHPDNAALKQVRKDPDVLYPSDLLMIPDLEAKQDSVDTDSKHTFRRKGVPAWLYLTFEDEDEPRVGEHYKIEVDGVLSEGSLDGDGGLNIKIPPDAKKAKVWIGCDDPVKFVLGGLDPVDEIEGVQLHLRNLGFYGGEVDGQEGPETEAAVMLFQKKNGLEPNGVIDGKTIEAIEKEHDIE